MNDYVNVEIDITGISTVLVVELANHLGLILLHLDNDTVQVEGKESSVDQFEYIISRLL